MIGVLLESKVIFQNHKELNWLYTKKLGSQVTIGPQKYTWIMLANACGFTS